MSFALAAVVGLGLGGCGIGDPYAIANRSTSPATSAPTRQPAGESTSRDPAPERGGSITRASRRAKSRIARGSGQPTRAAALNRYASLYINWSARTLGQVQAELAASSIGQARAQALQAAASYARDSTLERSHVHTTGVVVGIVPSRVTPGQWVVVTREQTTGEGEYAGLPPTLHVTYAELTRTTAGWIVDQWQPQN